MPARARRTAVSNRMRGATGWIALGVFVIAFPLFADAPLLRAGQYMMIGSVGAIGLTLLVGQAGQLSLGHGFFLFFGGTAYCVLSDTGTPGMIGLGLPSVVALIGAVVLTAGAGALFSPVAGRLSGIYLGVATLSLIFIGLYAAQSLPQLTGGTASGRAPTDISLFGFSLKPDPAGPIVSVFGVPLLQQERTWYFFALLLLLAYLPASRAVRSRVGRSWRAVRDNENAASILGVNVMRTKAGAFAVSSAYAGLAGIMTVLWFGLLKPDESDVGTYGINTSIAFLAMALIGGLGSVRGAVIGGVLVIGIPQLLGLYASDLPWMDHATEAGFTPTLIGVYAYGAAVVLITCFEPGGLAGLGRRFSRRAPHPTDRDEAASRTNQKEHDE